MRWSVARGELFDLVDTEEVHCPKVWITKAAIWGQTRGCLEEQRMTPIEGDVADDMASGQRCGWEFRAALVLYRRVCVHALYHRTALQVLFTRKRQRQAAIHMPFEIRSELRLSCL